MFLLSELNVDITNHVVSKVIANIEALNFSVLPKLLKQIFIEFLKTPIIEIA